MDKHTQRGLIEREWEPGASAGVELSVLAAASGSAPDETLLMRLAPGATSELSAVSVVAEVLVLEGRVSLGDDTLSASGYALGTGVRATAESEGCVLFVKRRFGTAQGEACVESSQLPWSRGQGNLRVKPLNSGGTEGTALVHWPPGERFVPHTHWGGEEIYVLSGTFRDEHGSYPAGTWIQSPHLSSHHPFVEEETVIFVKTGHLAL